MNQVVEECKFCGNSVCNSVLELTKEHDPWRTFQVICDACKARGPLTRSEPTAVTAWNLGVPLK